MADKIFVNGFFSHPVPDSAPSYVLADIGINVERLAKWLEDNKHLADEHGNMRWTIKESQKGTRYTEVNTWKPEKKDDGSVGLPPSVGAGTPDKSTSDGFPM